MTLSLCLIVKLYSKLIESIKMTTSPFIFAHLRLAKSVLAFLHNMSIHY